MTNPYEPKRTALIVTDADSNQTTTAYPITRLNRDLVRMISAAFGIPEDQWECILVVKRDSSVIDMGVPEDAKVESWFDERGAWSYVVGRTISGYSNVDITSFRASDGTQGTMICKSLGNLGDCWHYVG